MFSFAEKSLELKVQIFPMTHVCRAVTPSELPSSAYPDQIGGGSANGITRVIISYPIKRASHSQLYFDADFVNITFSVGLKMMRFLVTTLSLVCVASAHEMHTGQCPRFNPMAGFDWEKVSSVLTRQMVF